VLVAREALDVTSAALKPDFTGAACDCGSSTSSSGSNHHHHDHDHSHHHNHSGGVSSESATSLNNAAWKLLQWLQAPSASLVAVAQAQLLTPSGALKLPPLPSAPMNGGAFTESGGPTRRKPTEGGTSSNARTANVNADAAVGSIADRSGHSNADSSGVDLETGVAIDRAAKEEQLPDSVVLPSELPWAVDLDALQTAYEEEQNRNGIGGGNGCANASGSTKSGG